MLHVYADARKTLATLAPHDDCDDTGDVVPRSVDGGFCAANVRHAAWSLSCVGASGGAGMAQRMDTTWQTGREHDIVPHPQGVRTFV